ETEDGLVEGQGRRKVAHGKIHLAPLVTPRLFESCVHHGFLCSVERCADRLAPMRPPDEPVKGRASKKDTPHCTTSIKKGEVRKRSSHHKHPFRSSGTRRRARLTGWQTRANRIGVPT